MVVDADLREWDYGHFEGRKTDEIREEYPDWTIWRGPWPGGESIEEVAARADRILQRVGRVDGDVLIFSHGHLLRVLAARWLRREPRAGAMFALSTATISLLGWEREAPVIERWNEACGA
jgi:probable phosphoglycerate mutase